MNTPPPNKPRPNLPRVRPESNTTIVVEEESSNIWKVLVFLILLGGAGYAIYFHFTRPEEPTVAAAPLSTNPLDDMLDPTGRPPEDPTPKEIPETVIQPPPVETATTKHYSDFSSYEALQRATRQRFVDGLWAEHFTSITESCLETLNKRPVTSGPRQLDGLIQKKTLPLALAQLEIYRRLGYDNFLRWTAASPNFAADLLTDIDQIQLLVNNLVPEDYLPNVLSIWETLEVGTGSNQSPKRQRNLALSLALIYDNGNRVSEARAAYQYYTQTVRKRDLYVDFDKISPDELIYGVAPTSFGIDGMKWARDKFSFSIRDLGKVYFEVPYRLNHPPYPEYTIQNVMELGGVCVQQAQVAKANARSHGVPSAVLGGTGSRGGHAWFVYRKADGTWDNSTGRYNDGYACGTTTNPQTGKTMREWDFFLFNDSGRRNGAREAALTTIRAAHIMGDAGDTAEFLTLLEAAAKRNSSNPIAWRPYLETLRDDPTERPLLFWENLVRSYRNTMLKLPDHLAIIEEIEVQKIFPKQNPDQVAVTLRTRRREAFRKMPERFDLIVESVKREISYYRSTNDTSRIGQLYRNTFEDVGTHLPTFIAVANLFAEDAATDPSLRRRTLSTMEKVFNKQIDTDLKGDLFRLSMEAEVCQKLASFFDSEKEKTKANRYAKRAKVIREAADKKIAES